MIAKMINTLDVTVSGYPENRIQLPNGDWIYLSLVNDYGLYVEGLDKAQIKLANCCHPIKGDDVVGYISKGNGIIVHRLECYNVKTSDSQRFINVYWDKEYEGKNFETQLIITSYDKRNIVADMINVLNSTTVSIASISSSKNKIGDLITKIKLYVKDVEMLQNAITNLLKISDVYSVERVLK